MNFAYHRGIAPMMWVLVTLSGLELGVMHLLVAAWSRTAAVLLSMVSVAGIVWLIVTIRSFKALPVRLFDDRLVMRVGRIMCREVPIANIVGLRETWDAAALKQRSVLKLSLVAYPNVVIDLHEPLPGRRAIRTLAHRLDDPAAFVAALARVRAAHG